MLKYFLSHVIRWLWKGKFHIKYLKVVDCLGRSVELNSGGFSITDEEGRIKFEDNSMIDDIHSFRRIDENFKSCLSDTIGQTLEQQMNE